MNAQEVIARALALSEAATDGPWERKDKYWRPGGREVRIEYAPHCYAVAFCGTEANAEFVEAARTLLPALAKALGDVLAVCERSEMSPGSIRAYMADDITVAITAALSEVTP